MNRLVLDRSILAAFVLLAAGLALILDRLSAAEFGSLLTVVIVYLVGVGQGSVATSAPAPAVDPAVPVSAPDPRVVP